MKSEHTLFDPAQQWRCTSPEYRSTPSCSSADGRATHSCGTSGNKSNNSHNTSQSRCSRFDLFARSQTSPRELYRTKIPDSAIIETTPRLGEILDVTRLDECSCRPSLFSTDQLSNDAETINGGSITSDRRRRRERGELKLNFQFHTQPLVHILCTLLLCTTNRRGVWLRSCFVVWMQIE